MRDKVFAFAKARYDTNPEYLWDSSPDAAVLRHRRNRKWYAIVMLVRKSSLGLEGGGEKWVVNVRRDSAVKAELLEHGIKCLIVWECTIKRMVKSSDVEKRIIQQCTGFLRAKEMLLEL